MKGSTKSLLVGSALIAGAFLLFSRGKKGSSSEEGGQAGGQDEEMPSDELVQYIPGGIAPQEENSTPTNFTFLVSPSGFNDSSPAINDQSPIGGGSPSNYSPGGIPASFDYGLFNSSSNNSRSSAPAPSASNSTLASIGVVGGYGLLSDGLQRVGQAVAKNAAEAGGKQAVSAVPASFSKTLTQDPYGVLRGAGVPVAEKAALEAAEETPSLFLKFSKGVAAYIPVLGIPVGAAVDRYLTKDNPSTQPSWIQALAANTAGDLAQAGTVAAITASTGGIGAIGSYVASPAAAIATQEAVYKQMNKANIYDDLGITQPKSNGMNTQPLAKNTEATFTPLPVQASFPSGSPELFTSSQQNIIPMSSQSSFSAPAALISSLAPSTVAVSTPQASSQSSSGGGSSSSSTKISTSNTAKVSSSIKPVTKSSFKDNLAKIKKKKK